MKPSRVLLLFFLGLGLEWFWGTRLDVWGLAPRLLLLLTLAVASQAGPVAGQVYGFLWGLFLDVLSAHTFGAGALSLTLAGYLVGNLRRQMDVSSVASQMMVAAVASTAFWLLIGFAGLLFEHRFLWVGWKLFILGTLYNTLVAPAAFSLVGRTLSVPQTR